MTIMSLRTALFWNLIVGVSALVIFLSAWALKGRQRETGPEDGTREKLDLRHHPLHFFCELTYWGTILALVTSISCVVVVCSSLMQTKVNARVTNPSPPPNAPVKFPSMRLQGVVLRGSQSSVMIDGKIYFLGDYIRDIRVVAIDAESATLELSGQTNILVLPK